LKPAGASAIYEDILTMFVTPAFAQTAGAGGLGGIGQFLPLILIFAIMYFLLIRPQQKKAKQHREMVSTLRRGDQVITQGGIVGKVTKVKEDGEVEVEIATGVKIRVIQSTIATVLSKTEPADK
jgi:preprotein translocase subunit YajC